MKIEIEGPERPGFELEILGEPEDPNNDDLFYFGADGRAMSCHQCALGLTLPLYRKVEPPKPEYIVFRRDDDKGYQLEMMGVALEKRMPHMWLEVTNEVTVIEGGNDE